MESGGQDAISPASSAGIGRNQPVSGAGGLREPQPSAAAGGEMAGAAGSSQGEWGLRVCGVVNPLMRRIRRRPLFQKVVMVNTVLIIVGALIGHYFEERYFTGGDWGLVGLFIISGISLSILINYLMVKLAFHPLDDVSEAMKAIRAGHRGIRVPEATDDPQVKNLSRSFNLMLDAMETARKRAAASVIKAQEEERRRIARELHDETSQSLTGLIIGIKMVEETIPKTMPDLRERLANIKDLAHQTLNEVHTMAVRLRPSILDDLGLAAALRSYGKELSDNTGIRVDMQLMGLTERLTPELETVLYRVVQEALTNVVRHAEAHNCRVNLRRQEQAVRVMIEDDGRGFEPGQTMASEGSGRGLGLHGMRERIELVGGTIEFESRPGAGATIFIEAPLKGQQSIW